MATTLTETIIDLADQHTTLCFVGTAKSATAKLVPNTPTGGGTQPLPIMSEKQYDQLHATIATTATATDYAQVHGAPGVILRVLSRACEDNRYWSTVMAPNKIDTWPKLAWQQFIPIEATITNRVSFVSRPGWSFKVSPLPSVLLYPFGWSTWIGLRIVGPHSKEDLADVLGHVFRGRAFQPAAPFRPADGSSPLFLTDLFDRIAEGVRTDAFDGERTGDREPRDVVAVTTVLAKHGGSPSLGALTSSDEQTMRRLVRPDGPPASSPFDDHVYRLKPAKELEYIQELEYMLKEDRKRFIWLEHLLRPEERNRSKLRCYHNNTFRSLVHAGHLLALIEAVDQIKKPPTSLKKLRAAAADSIAKSPYKNASLREFLKPVVAH